MDYTAQDIESLAAKLAAAGLNAGEQAVLAALVDAAQPHDEPEVAGFSMNSNTFSFAPLKPAEFLRLGPPTAFPTDTTTQFGGSSKGGGTNV